MILKEIISYLETLAPLSLQESYDNSGLIIGDVNSDISSVLLTIDTTEEVVAEAISKNANLIISHHPIIFTGLKTITGKNYIERTIIKAIKNNIAIYSMHTNLDIAKNGVNDKICEKLNLINCKSLDSEKNLLKLAVYTPVKFADKVRKAMFSAGAGDIGNYSECSFNINGEGSFKASENTKPFVGEKNKIHYEDEIKIETVFPEYLKGVIINSMIKAHPYEEVAYDIYKLENKNNFGLGRVGLLKEEISEIEFLKKLKTVFGGAIRYTNFRNKPVKKVALCGGSCSFMLNKAINSKADFFISSDFKYHQFFDAENKIVIADLGHFETEQFTKELFYDNLTKKFTNFAIHFSKIKTNPINYY